MLVNPDSSVSNQIFSKKKSAPLGFFLFITFLFLYYCPFIYFTQCSYALYTIKYIKYHITRI